MRILLHVFFFISTSVCTLASLKSITKFNCLSSGGLLELFKAAGLLIGIEKLFKAADLLDRGRESAQKLLSLPK